MRHRFVIETVEPTLREICDQQTKPCRGKLIGFRGDFKQILQVTTKESNADTVGASLSRSNFWPDCHVLHPKINMQLTDPNLSKS